MIALLLALSLLQETPAEARLRHALDEAKRELAAEEARIDRETAALESELTDAKAASAKLSDEIVDRTVSIAQKNKELEALRAERGELRKTHAVSRDAWAAIHRTATEARQKLADFIGALPPSEGRAEQQALLVRAKSALERPAGEPIDLESLLNLGRLLLDESRSTAAFAQSVRTGDGVAEDVEVLRAGLIFHAYRSKATGRIGEVFAAPIGATGYRWSESLTEKAREIVRNAFAATGATIDLPIDVTQRLSPDRRGAGQGLFEVLKAGGLVMIPLAFVALLAGLIVIDRLIVLARAGSPDADAVNVIELSRAGRVDEAARIASSSRGTRMRALAAALGRRDAGKARMEEAVQESVLHEMPALERFLPMLAVLAGVAPMLGLLGTVTGMITTFDVIRLFGSGDPGIMAGGISEALIATASGLVIAIPLLLFHSWFSGRVDRILADTQRHATTLVGVVSNAPKPEAVRVE